MKKYIKCAYYDVDRIRFPRGESNIETEYRIKGLSQNALAFVRDIIGQLSDGYWENSPVMESYWPYVSVEGSDLVIKPYNEYYDRQGRYCRFSNMNESHIKQWFADKIKQLAKEESGKWSRTDKTELDWLHGTVSDAYQAYDELKGRSGHVYGSTVLNRR